MKIDLGLRTDSKLEYIRCEGMQAYRNRVRDRADEVKRLRKLKKIEPADGRLSIGVDPPPVLNVSSFPPAPVRSGAVTHMLERLHEEKKRRPVALAYPRDGTWWIELWLDDQAGISALGAKANLVELLGQAARLVGARAIHIESLLGLPVNLPHGLEKAGVRTIVSIHDFSLFCRRPHLIDSLTGRFCEYCQDLARCGVCLRDMDPDGRYPQRDYRKISSASISSASALVFPSAFVQRQHRELFEARQDDQREFVIAPATVRPDLVVDRSDLGPNVGFIGGVTQHKGGRLIPPIIGRIRSQQAKATGFVYGSGDLDLVNQIKKAKGLKIRGYYRPGTLAAQLARDKIAVAVMPSISPESYSIVIDECLATGTPVVALDHGAVADRLEFWSVGELVPAERGAEGLADAALGMLRGRKVGTDVIRTLPNIERVAQKYIDAYRSLRQRRTDNGV